MPLHGGSLHCRSSRHADENYMRGAACSLLVRACAGPTSPTQATCFGAFPDDDVYALDVYMLPKMMRCSLMAEAPRGCFLEFQKEAAILEARFITLIMLFPVFPAYARRFH